MLSHGPCQAHPAMVDFPAIRGPGVGVLGSMTGAPFISTVIGSLDSKGRVCIPAAYRHILAAQNTAGVYICPSFSETALEAFGQTLLEQVSARLATQDPFFSPAHDDQATAIIA